MLDLSGFNAFAFLKENIESPHSRSLRSSYWGKLRDTFKAFYGQLNVDEGIESMGIFDYLSLAIFFLVTQALYWCIDNYSEKKTALFFLVPTALLSLAGFIARLAISLVMTLLLSPLVFFVHQSIELVAARKLKRLAYSLEGVDNSTTPFEASKKYCLSDFLKNHHRSADEMNVSLKKSQTRSYLWGNQSKQTLTLKFKYTHVKDSGLLSKQQLFVGGVLFLYLAPCLIPFLLPKASKSTAETMKEWVEGAKFDCFDVEIDTEDTIQNTQLSALFKLNLSKALETLNLGAESKEVLKPYTR